MFELFLQSIKLYTAKAINTYELYLIHFIAKIIAAIYVQIFIIVLFLLAITFFSIGLSLWIGNLIGVTYWGFIIISIIYLIVGILLSSIKSGILKKKIIDSITKNL